MLQLVPHGAFRRCAGSLCSGDLSSWLGSTLGDCNLDTTRVGSAMNFWHIQLVCNVLSRQLTFRSSSTIPRVEYSCRLDLLFQLLWSHHWHWGHGFTFISILRRYYLAAANLRWILASAVMNPDARVAPHQALTHRGCSLRQIFHSTVVFLGCARVEGSLAMLLEDDNRRVVRLAAAMPLHHREWIGRLMVETRDAKVIFFKLGCSDEILGWQLLNFRLRAIKANSAANLLGWSRIILSRRYFLDNADATCSVIYWRVWFLVVLGFEVLSVRRFSIFFHLKLPLTVLCTQNLQVSVVDVAVELLGVLGIKHDLFLHLVIVSYYYSIWLVGWLSCIFVPLHLLQHLRWLSRWLLLMTYDVGSRGCDAEFDHLVDNLLIVLLELALLATFMTINCYELFQSWGSRPVSLV